MWTATFSRKAEKAISALHPEMRKRVSDAIDALCLDPFTARQVKALKGSDDFRLRVGNVRVIYKLRKDRLIIVIIDIGPRGGIY